LRAPARKRHPQGIILKEHRDIAAVEFVGRQDAIGPIDLEERNRGHQGAGELEGAFWASERSFDIVRLHRERANSRSMAPQKGQARSRSLRRQRRERRHVHVADPAAG